MKSTIFFRDFTNLDCSYIDDKGIIHGSSQLLTCYMTGETTESESVVLDFSKGKKQLKSIIDDKEKGFDHKLVIFEDSLCGIQKLNKNYVKITSPHLELEIPKNAIKQCKSFNCITDLVNSEMQRLYPKLKLECKIESNLKGTGTDGFVKYFNYVHGLKDSSSFGCQNIAHGHLSFVEVFGIYNGVKVSDTRTADDIAAFLNDSILINRKNIIEENNGYIIIQYKSCNRGTMKAIIKQPHKIIVLDSETTIEFITDFISKRFFNQLKGKILRISEGLQKGSEICII